MRRWAVIGSMSALVIFSGALVWLRSSAEADRAAEDFADPGGCTTAVIAGFATANGRPLLWKNRDVSQPHQEIVYFNDGAYDYVTIANAGDSTQAWGGVNSAGFAIEDANNWNTPDTVAGPEDDGLIIKRALQTCRTVSDFQLLLDSTSVVGHTQPAIFGVIDSAGGAAMFETFAHSYVRYDATDPADAPLGVLTRSNFSYAGSSGGRIGVYRHDRAQDLIEAAVQAGTLDAHYMCRTVARDLRISNSFNPYPLPFEGQTGGLPTGWISTYGAICRRLTVSACVIEGVLAGEHPQLSTLWAFPMAVQYGVALPFWVASQTTPAAVNGDVTGPLCDEGLRIKTLAQHFDGFRDTLDTYVLNDAYGGGVHPTTFPLEDRIFAQADSALAVWRAAGEPHAAEMTLLSARLAQMAYDTLSVWPQAGDLTLPPQPVDGLTSRYIDGAGVRLRWYAVRQNTVGLPVTPTHYDVWAFSSIPFVRAQGEFLGSTPDTVYTIPGVPADVWKYYDVRAILIP